MTEAHWLPAVKPEWSMLRLKRIVSCPVVKGDGIAYPFVALEHIRSASGAVNPDFEWSPQSSEDCILFRVGDVLFGKLRPYLRKYLQADRNGCCQSELLVLRPRDMRLSTRFLFYVVQSEPFVAWADATSYGVKMPRTSWESLGIAEVLLPSTSDQDSICAFLDRETARIDALIEKKERLITLLEEKRAALINRAVTKGLDPSAPVKESGVSCLGLVPAHWQVKRLKNVSVGGLVNGLFKTKDAYGDGTPLINVADVYQKDHRIRFESLGRVRATPADVDKYLVLSGDVFFVRSSLKLEGTGASALVDHLPESAVFECHLVRLRPEPCLVAPRFLALYLNSALVRQHIVAMAQTTTMSTIGQNELACLPALLPPLLEQEQVCAAVDADARRIDCVIDKIRQQISEFQEYRTALISAAVTGKIDVRGSAQV